jgi:beta-lactam-binding protein with PASTA domain
MVRFQLSDEYGMGFVVGQDPPPGNLMEEGMPVDLLVSRGPGPQS